MTDDKRPPSEATAAHVGQHIAGLWCDEVLAVLSDYVDGVLDDATRAQVEAHVQECDECARFGADFAAMVGAIRAQLASPPTVDDDVSARLFAALDLDAVEPSR